MSGNWAKAFSRGSGEKGQGGWGGRAEHRGLVPGEAAGAHHHRDRGRRRSAGVPAVGGAGPGGRHGGGPFGSPRAGPGGGIQPPGGGQRRVGHRAVHEEAPLQGGVPLRRVGGRRGGSDASPAGRALRPVRTFGDGAALRDPGNGGRRAVDERRGLRGEHRGAGGVGGSRRRRGGDPQGRGAGDPVRVPGGEISRPGDRGAGRVPVRGRDEGGRVRADAAVQREASRQPAVGGEDLRIRVSQSSRGRGKGQGAARAGGDEGRGGKGTPASPRSTRTSS